MESGSSDPRDEDVYPNEAELKKLEEELTQDVKEKLLTQSPFEAEQHPGVYRQIQSVCLMTWKESDGNTYEGTGFLAKMQIGDKIYHSFCTAGHCIIEKKERMVNFDSMKLKFKHIGTNTKSLTLKDILKKLKSHVIVCALDEVKIIIKENGEKEVKTCKPGVDFCSIIFTSPVEKTAKRIINLGLNFLDVADQGTCAPSPNCEVTLIGFPRYVNNLPSQMRCLVGKELPMTPGKLPDTVHDIETAKCASGSPVSKKNGQVKAIHVSGNKHGNKGLSFDVIREEMCLNIPSLPSQAQPGTSDPHKPQGMPSVVKFMKNLELDEYISAFEEHHIDMEVLEDCEPEELEQMLEKMEVSFGHSKKIKKALKHEKQEKKKQMKKEQEREEDQLDNIGVNETAAASNVKMSCGVIIGIIVAVIAVIAVIAPYYYEGGVGSVSKWVLYNNSPGCGADFISTPAECKQAAQKLGFTGQMNPGRWSDKPPGCSAGTEGFIYFNQDVVGTTGITSLRSLCLFPGSAVIPEAFALTIPGCEEEDDVVYYGHDLVENKVFPHGSVADCANWCGEVEECKFWTFEKTAKKCWLKDDKGTDRRIDHDRVSGSKECADPKSDLIVSADEGEAAEHHGYRMGLYRPLDGSSYQQVGGRNYLYQVLPERVWYIGDALMARAGGRVMINPTESSSVPASGWKFWDGSEWRDDPLLSVRMLGQELQCNTITITSSQCTRQEVLGDFRRIKNDVLNGHPVFRNSFNHYLRVPTGGTTWSVGPQRDGGDSWLQSGRATSCPAHTNSGLMRKRNRKHWTLADGKNNWVEDTTFVVTCNVKK